MTLAPRPTPDEWWTATLDLLPPGRAWPRDRDTVIARYFGVLARERYLRHGRALDLLDVEAWPGTALEALPDWERVAGLPDPCRPVLGSMVERQRAVLGKLALRGGQTPEFFVALAASVGYTIAIVEHQAFYADISDAGDPVDDEDFRWTVRALDQAVTWFEADISTGDDPLWSATGLEALLCVIRRAAPAHTLVDFAAVEPPQPRITRDGSARVTRDGRTRHARPPA
jgi:uncharacterized protein YmfQ (DUF2313 family)